MLPGAWFYVAGGRGDVVWDGDVASPPSESLWSGELTKILVMAYQVPTCLGT